MLDKTNYFSMSAIRTDLPKKEVDALLWVRERLLDGRIGKRHFDMDKVMDTSFRIISKAHPASFTKYKSCGSVGCIAGWAGVGMKMSIDETVEWMWSKSHYYNLFMPSNWIMDNALPEDGAKAIENFLMKHEDPWAFMEEKYED
jgi:hypothetical protein